MQQNTQISREKWEVQYVHSEVIGKSVWGEFREERQRDLTTGPCRGRRMQPQSQTPDPSPQAALCAEASASAAGKAGRSRRRDRPCVGWGWTGMCSPAGAGLGKLRWEGGCGKEPRRPFLFHRDKKGRDVEGRVRLCFTGKSYTPRSSRNGSRAQLKIGV